MTEYSLHTAYAVDKKAAQFGRWFDFPELGRGARLLIASTKCNPDYKRVREQHFKTKYWDRGKQAPQNVQDAKAPLIYGETIVRGMKNVPLRPGEAALEDNLSNRIRLIQFYGEPLIEDIDAIANELENYRPEEIMQASSEIVAADVAAEVERAVSTAEGEAAAAGGDDAEDAPETEQEAASGN